VSEWDDPPFEINDNGEVIPLPEDFDPENFDQSLNPNSERFVIPGIEFEWKNYGVWVDTNNDTITVNDTCSSFRLCSNQKSFDGGQCLTMTTGFFCQGCDPMTGICKLYKHGRARPYKPNSLRQQWVYDAETKQLRTIKNDIECLTLQAVDNVTFPELGMDPCAEVYHGQIYYGGGWAYNMPCINRTEMLENNYLHQQWEFTEGLLTSGCPHGHPLADIFPFIGVAAEDLMPGGVFVYRYGQEVEVEKDFKEAGKQVLNYYLNDTTYSEVLGHGCWCSTLDRSNIDPSEVDWHGPKIVDEVDYLCKRWYMARKCIVSKDGVCQSDSMTDTYTISFDHDECPWDGGSTCGFTVNHLNSEACCGAACEIDSHFSEQIREYLEEHDWVAQDMGDRRACKCPECVGRGNGNPGKEKCCTGEPPNVELVDCPVEREVEVAHVLLDYFDPDF